MKKKIALCCMLFLSVFFVKAQHLRLNAYANYVFDDSFDSYYDFNNYKGYSGKIMGGLQWGLGLEYMLQPSYGVEISYLRQDTHAPTDYFETNNSGGFKHTDFDVALNYIMLGGTRYLVNNPKVNPYFGLSAGACIVEAKNPDKGTSGSATKFAWGLKAGVLLNASETVGIKLQASLLSAVQSAGGGVYFGTGGVGTGVSTYSSMYQFGLGGGLVISFGGKK